jgi:plasmid stabilization system protein ParE
MLTFTPRNSDEWQELLEQAPTGLKSLHYLIQTESGRSALVELMLSSRSGYVMSAVALPQGDELIQAGAAAQPAASPSAAEREDEEIAQVMEQLADFADLALLAEEAELLPAQCLGRLHSAPDGQISLQAWAAPLVCEADSDAPDPLAGTPWRQATPQPWQIAERQESPPQEAYIIAESLSPLPMFVSAVCLQHLIEVQPVYNG